jgi:hypothetical protein
VRQIAFLCFFQVFIPLFFWPFKFSLHQVCKKAEERLVVGEVLRNQAEHTLIDSIQVLFMRRFIQLSNYPRNCTGVTSSPDQLNLAKDSEFNSKNPESATDEFAGLCSVMSYTPLSLHEILSHVTSLIDPELGGDTSRTLWQSIGGGSEREADAMQQDYKQLLGLTLLNTILECGGVLSHQLSLTHDGHASRISPQYLPSSPSPLLPLRGNVVDEGLVPSSSEKENSFVSFLLRGADSGRALLWNLLDDNSLLNLMLTCKTIKKHIECSEKLWEERAKRRWSKRMYFCDDVHLLLKFTWKEVWNQNVFQPIYLVSHLLSLDLYVLPFNFLSECSRSYFPCTISLPSFSKYNCCVYGSSRALSLFSHTWFLFSIHVKDCLLIFKIPFKLFSIAFETGVSLPYHTMTFLEFIVEKIDTLSASPYVYFKYAMHY